MVSVLDLVLIFCPKTSSLLSKCQLSQPNSFCYNCTSFLFYQGPGLSTVDGGVVVDLRELKGIRVDTENQTIRW